MRPFSVTSRGSLYFRSSAVKLRRSAGSKKSHADVVRRLAIRWHYVCQPLQRGDFQSKKRCVWAIVTSEVATLHLGLQFSKALVVRSPRLVSKEPLVAKPFVQWGVSSCGQLLLAT